MWEWVWLGVGSRCVWGWDSVRRAVDMIEGRVMLVAAELAWEWSWVG